RQQHHRAEARSSGVMHSATGGDADEERGEQERTGRVADAELVVAQERRERLDHGWRSPTPASGRCVRVVAGEVRKAGLELPAIDGHVSACIGSVTTKSLEEIDRDRVRKVEWLLLEDATGEVTQHVSRGLARRQGDEVVGAERVGVVVDPESLVERDL